MKISTVKCFQPKPVIYEVVRANGDKTIVEIRLRSLELAVQFAKELILYLAKRKKTDWSVLILENGKPIEWRKTNES